jgi:polyisoprenyl-teichoic acid--peptidoglycan teichoic acid transferase
VARRPRPRRTWPQRLLLLFNVVIIGAALASAATLAYAKDTVSSIPRIAFQANTLAEEDPGTDEPLNFLLVGADSASNLDEDDPLRNVGREANQLTDTMIVLRVDPASGAASVMSIPRDLWVPISDLGYSEKINSALAADGEEGLVATITNFLDIPIHRYVQVDFNGFLQLVRVLDGIRVQIDHPLRDDKAHLLIEETGCVTLSPRQSLGYVRSRTLQAFVDDEWRLVDVTSDFGRIQRQQDFLVIALQRAFDQGLRNPNTLRGLVEDVFAGGYVQLDTRTTIAELLSLGRDFENFRAESLERYTLPVEVGTVGQASVVFLREADAQQVLNVFRGRQADDISFRVAVRNGTGASGLAVEVQEALSAEGFNVVESSNAENFFFEATVIRHDPSQRAQAELLERWLVTGAVLEARDTETAGPIDVIVGTEWEGVLPEPRPAPTPDPSVEPTPTSTPSGPTPTPTPTPEPLAQIRAC